MQATISDEMDRKFSKRLENTVGKGEIARYEQFLLFPHVFKRLVLRTRKNQGLFGKGLNVLNIVEFVLDRVENFVRKEENDVYKHFLTFK